MSIYQDLKAAGVPMDNHESDLYAKVTPDSVRIVESHGRSHSRFRSEIDGEMWFDIAFAFEPFWDSKVR